MEFITAAEAKNAYEEGIKEQLEKLDKIIRSVMRQQKGITLFSSMDNDESVKNASKNAYEDILETRKLYPDFKGINTGVQDVLRSKRFRFEKNVTRYPNVKVDMWKIEWG